jgi:uncharacterized protein
VTARTVFIDTWAWIQLGHPREDRHEEVKAACKEFESQGTALVTTDYVLSETITLLFKRESAERAVKYLEQLIADTKSERIMLERIGENYFEKA